VTIRHVAMWEGGEPAKDGGPPIIAEIDIDDYPDDDEATRLQMTKSLVESWCDERQVADKS
jgi:hypothetical protein